MRRSAPIGYPEASQYPMPEQTLAVAIIWRAVRDWKYGMDSHLVISNRRKSTAYRVLDWFFFSRDAEPMNLEFLCLNYLQSDHLCEAIRSNLGKPGDWWEGKPREPFNFDRALNYRL